MYNRGGDVLQQASSPATRGGHWRYADEVRVGIQDYVRLTALRTPHRTAVVLGDGTKFDYLELNSRVNRLASQFAAEGVHNGTRVALMGVDSHRYLETYLALFELGATVVPLNFRLAQREFDNLVRKAEPEVLLFSGRYAGMLEHAADIHPYVRLYICFDGQAGPGVDYEQFLAVGEDCEPDVPRPRDTDIAALAFTSGTTGLPKGVQQSYGMLSRLVLNNTLDYGALPDDFWYCASPLFHVAGLAYPMMQVVRGGANLIIPQFDAQTILDFVNSDMQLTCMFVTPTMLSMILGLPGAETARWDRLRLIAYGSASISPALLRNAMDLIGCDFINTFGAGTEAGSQTTLGPAEHRRALRDKPELLGSIGLPATGVELRICDADWNDVPRGEVGEIVTRSATVMSGYLDMPEETALVFGEGGWFRGGDLGCQDEEGYVFLKGRSKDMIIRGGENIYPVEVENVLAEHPGIELSAVVGKADERWGQIVRAWVVRHAGARVTANELRDLCRENLARYKVPTEIVFVDDLPRNASGKILKRELVNWEPADHAGRDPD